MRYDVQPLKILSGSNQYDMIVVTNNSVDYRLNNCEEVKDFDDCVIMTPGAYNKVFGKKRKNSSGEMKLLSVVKLEYKGRAIYRMYIGRSRKDFTDDMVAITPRSWRLLTNENLCPTKKCVTASPGSKFMYYWFHPFHATRIAMRIGVISIILSLILSFIGWFY